MSFDRSDLVRAVIHEWGHGTTAMALGYAFIFLRVEYRDGGLEGLTRWWGDAPPREEAMVTVAGYCAECMVIDHIMPTIDGMRHADSCQYDWNNVKDYPNLQNIMDEVYILLK